MSENAVFRILVLPRKRYWEWVDAVRDYALQANVSITAYPQTALEFHFPDQAITIVNPASGYPSFGDLRAWFATQAPSLRVYSIDADAPETLAKALTGQVFQRASNASGRVSGIVADSPGFRLAWPVDSPRVTQAFAANPEIYRRWGLPGHEGIDIEAPTNSSVRACADGVVSQVHDGSAKHPYGIHVRIAHQQGFSTIYAHLNEALVSQGQPVRIGDLIGHADSTGNTLGGHLHLGLKQAGATAAGRTQFPNDIVDPTPYLTFDVGKKPAALGIEWPYGRCLIGFQARAGGAMRDEDWEALSVGGVEAVALVAPLMVENVANARRVQTDMFLLARLWVDVRDRVAEPADFAKWVEPDAVALYSRGVRYFEIHNEPNLAMEGWGRAWHTGAEFGDWFLRVIGHLRPRMPDARFGWPGLSPGHAVDGLRADSAAFIASADSAVRQADWIGCHCFWTCEEEMISPDAGMAFQALRDRWPSKLLLITQFGNSLPVDTDIAARQVEMYRNLLRQQVGIGAAFSGSTAVWRA